jgi:radical SAM superfamily enzyme YgiQ (UPF0313 family)
MPDIVLTTLNAKFIHAAFGLRYLLANLGELQPRAVLAEFDINQRPLDIAEALLAGNPVIIGFGVYIWNVTETAEVIAALKRVRPELLIILGGPEVSHETEGQPIVELADYVITGEADLPFADLCRQLLGGERPATRILLSPLPELSRLELPYDLYTDADLAHRVVYVEASRGCPFTCEFCLSSLDIPVRQVPLDRMLAALQRLLDRGLQRFKFVDRTFNLHLANSRALLQFFLDRYRPGLFLHFEMIPDRLPDGLREVIAKFPAGALQFEVGIQTFNEDVCERISRRQDLRRLKENFRFLREQTGVHVHADLIVGLPGETMESFAAGFDRLVALGPQEIQVGILKRLRGTPIGRHDAEWGMRYHAHPPYEVLQTRVLPFATLQRLRRFARYWDLVANSGNFIELVQQLWNAADSATSESHAAAESEAGASPFVEFLQFSDWLHQRVGRTDGIALPRLAEFLYRYLVDWQGRDPHAMAMALWRDWQRAGRRDPPEFIRLLVRARAGDRPVMGSGPRSDSRRESDEGMMVGGADLPKRQARRRPTG